MAPSRWPTVIGLAAMSTAYETWHYVDVPSVVCPEQADFDAGFPKYEIGIDYSTSLDEHVPHVFSVLRTSGKPVTVTFEVKDDENKVVVPSKTVTLMDLDAPDTTQTCECTGISLQSACTDLLCTEYPPSYGKFCSDWDNLQCEKLWPGAKPAEWCCKKWCYASATCTDRLASTLLPDKYYSYSACDSSPPATCQWSRPRDACECQSNAKDSFSLSMRQKFPDNYGSSCKSWDEETCDLHYEPHELDDWCCANWCYVEAGCPTAVASFNEGVSLFWSSMACDQNSLAISQCMYKPILEKTPDNLRKCQCLGETVDGDIRAKYSLPESYGKLCGAHDAYECDKFNPGLTKDIWCCQSWCWVSPDCPDGQASLLWPGKYYSGLDCEEDEDVLVHCIWSDACKCTGENVGLVAEKNGISAQLQLDASSAPCGDWCADHTSDWAAKCSHYMGCVECPQCQVPTPQPSLPYCKWEKSLRWCKGHDQRVGTKGSLYECWISCVAAFPNIAAVDFHPNGNCFCQDKCDTCGNTNSAGVSLAVVKGAGVLSGSCNEANIQRECPQTAPLTPAPANAPEPTPSPSPNPTALVSHGQGQSLPYCQWENAKKWCKGHDKTVGVKESIHECWVSCEAEFQNIAAIDFHPSGKCFCQDKCDTCGDSPPAGLSLAVIKGLGVLHDSCNEASIQRECPQDAVAEPKPAPEPEPTTPRRAASGFVLPPDYGKSCKSWDAVDCIDMWGPGTGEFNLWDMSGKNDWCCKPWCYVSTKCPIAVESKLGAPPYLYASCKDETSAQRAYYEERSDACIEIKENEIQPQGVMDICKCLGESPPDVPPGAPSNYGSMCQAWDADECAKYYRDDTYDMWCCLPWCYVDSRCPNAKESSIWPGHFYSEQYSDLTCDVNSFVQTIRECKYSDACGCLGFNGLPDSLSYLQVPADYGATCSDWDSVDCFDRWGDTEAWDKTTGGRNDWCCKDWCYVSFACPIAWGPTDNGMAYTYEAACAPNGRSYNRGTDTCSDRRLTATENGNSIPAEETRTILTDSRAFRVATESKEKVKAHEWESSIAGYVLNAVKQEEMDFLGFWLPKRNRRGKGSSGSNSGSRSTTNTANLRRRYPVRGTSTVQLRRRAAQSNSRAAADLRRRAPSSSNPRPAGVPSSAHRRRQSVSDKRWQTPNAGSSAYGYTSRPTLMNNYGGNMPSQTSYGYSGQNAYSSNHRPQIAMYSPGHGRYNTYNGNYNNNNYRGGGAYMGWFFFSSRSSFRRRRGRTEWCVVPSNCDRLPDAGQIIECEHCYDRCGWGMCASTNDCYSETGCRYTMPQAVNRDDLMETGFLPKNFKFPLTVIIKSLTGDGFDKASVCPSPDDAAPRYNAGLFVTLTSVTPLGNLPAPTTAPRSVSTTEFGTPVRGVDTDGVTYYDFKATSTSCYKTLIEVSCEEKMRNAYGGAWYQTVPCAGENEECIRTGDPYVETGGNAEKLCACAGDWCAENAASHAKATCNPPHSHAHFTLPFVRLIVVCMLIAYFRA